MLFFKGVRRVDVQVDFEGLARFLFGVGFGHLRHTLILDGVLERLLISFGVPGRGKHRLNCYIVASVALVPLLLVGQDCVLFWLE